MPKHFSVLKGGTGAGPALAGVCTAAAAAIAAATSTEGFIPNSIALQPCPTEGPTRKSLFGENRHRGPVFRGRRGKIVTAALDKYRGGAVTTADRDGGSEELDGRCPIPPRIGIEPGLIRVDPARRFRRALIGHTEELVDGTLLHAAIDCDRVEAPGENSGPGGLARVLADQDLGSVELVDRLKAAGDVNGIADHRV